MSDVQVPAPERAVPERESTEEVPERESTEEVPERESTEEAPERESTEEVGRGDVIELEIGEVAHGGHCVARFEGRVVFVRHTLPGEVVRARITSAGRKDRYWRADAVEVLTASPDRVEPRCALSGPGGCGGCDWQHAALGAQRGLKAHVVTELMRRLGGIEIDVLQVEHVPTGDPDGDVGGSREGLDWRTRERFTVDEAGRTGFHRHRSHDVIPVESCPIAHPKVDGLGIGTGRWRGAGAVEVVTPATGPEALVVVEPAGPPERVRVPKLNGTSGVAVRDAAASGGLRRISGRTWVAEHVEVLGSAHDFRVSGAGFWQVHPGAARTLTEAVLQALDPQPGDQAVDLYSGGGLFTLALAERVGEGGAVTAVEADRRAVADAKRSLHGLFQVELVQADVAEALARLEVPMDVVVLDPPRTGAGAEVIEAICARGPRAVAYVSCDPATLARDVATATAAGYRLTGLRAFDLFPMTHHVECVAILEPA